MAFEAVIIELLGNGGDPVRYTVANGTGIEKGTLLKLTDPRTAIANSGNNDDLAGIAAAEKVANDGSTSLAVYTNGIFDMKASGAITVGQPVRSSSTANHVAVALNDTASGAKVLGYALETATDGEVIAVRVKL